MKKYLLYAAAIFGMAACAEEEKNEPVAPEEKPDSIELFSQKTDFGPEGGKAQVIITSSGEWTLTSSEKYDWVSPDISSGKDGDVVTFTVGENTGRDKKTAVFDFASGKASESITITSTPADLPELVLKSEAEKVFDYNFHDDYIIKVYAKDIYYQSFKVQMTEGAESWLTHVVTLPGETDNDAELHFSLKGIENKSDREATVTISAEGTVAPVEVKIIQEAKRILSTNEFFAADKNGETIAVPVESNVEYSINIESADGTDWVKHVEKKGNSEYFKVEPLNGGSKRSATVTLTQTDAREGVEPLKAVFYITQQDVVIAWAAKMNTARLFPKWENGGPGHVSAFTWEMMFKPENFDKNDGSVFTLMGIEGKFLLRFGDVGNKRNRIQIDTYGYSSRFNVEKEFEPDRWYHLAVTYYSGRICLYIDGKQEFKKICYEITEGVDISPKWSDESNGQPRCFWLGYSYDASRDFRGLMTEVRIWTRELQMEEINAEGHFYSVDPQSEGLYSYWKFVSGTGNYIEDATGRGNNLYGQTNVRTWGSGIQGKDGINFVPVALPER